ncbi:hypothetical protein DsansV1_C02g0018951 [Dioscorea sansibarensis]
MVSFHPWLRGLLASPSVSPQSDLGLGFHPSKKQSFSFPGVAADHQWASLSVSGPTSSRSTPHSAIMFHKIIMRVQGGPCS